MERLASDLCTDGVEVLLTEPHLAYSMQQVMANYLAQGRSFSIQELLFVLDRLLAIQMLLHDLGVVQSYKPGSIFVSINGEVKVYLRLAARKEVLLVAGPAPTPQHEIAAVLLSLARGRSVGTAPGVMRHAGTGLPPALQELVQRLLAQQPVAQVRAALGVYPRTASLQVIREMRSFVESLEEEVRKSDI